jgi:CHAD domain-containing protein
MGYRFKEHETVPDGIKRIALELIDKAIEQTKPQVKNRDKVIHDTRVIFKKLRALLRLTRVKNNAETFRHEDACFRNAGRRLSRVRDTTAMIEALDKMTERYADQLEPDAFAELRKPFIRTRRTQQADKNEAIAEAVRVLESARSRVADWPIDDEGFSSLREGLKRTYKKGCMCMWHVQDKPSVENLHEWRKRVKDLWYQVRLLSPLWPGVLKDLANELGRLADCLSDDHDLAILRQAVLRRPSDERAQVEALVALIDQHRGELEMEAKRLGERLYVETPNAFVRRFEMYWRVWCAEETVASLAVG